MSLLPNLTLEILQANQVHLKASRNTITDRNQRLILYLHIELERVLRTNSVLANIIKSREYRLVCRPCLYKCVITRTGRVIFQFHQSTCRRAGFSYLTHFPKNESHYYLS